MFTPKLSSKKVSFNSKFNSQNQACLSRNSWFKNAPFLLCLIAIQPCFASAELSPYDLQVTVAKSQSGFHIQASYVAPVSQCEAYAFLTDYEDIKTIPGIVESKVRRRSGNKVTVERLIEERIMLFPVQLRSEVEFTEIPNQGLNFLQTKGDSKSYSGTWRLQPSEKGIQVKYSSVVEPDSFVPSGVIEYFMKNNIRRTFELMAASMERNRDVLNLACR
ncbi:SRPBCC family protein [Polynucleobacter sp. CS-Odin-A6]|uniref:SRPBCC family protein n=1 Tax=Polynucleobacter sp. CS-Odin-A6 TaxID=2689106 RepID=UPI001C0BD4A0|nr:SRPBCC family protein [Polynucleobacter sp. CS-Odin-A6]